MASALVVSMQGCSNEPSFEPNSDSKVQLRLTGEINPTTRVNADGFTADDAVGVYVSTTGMLAESGNYFDNQKFTYAKEGEVGELKADIPIYWPTKDSELSVYAYYPFDEEVSSTSAYPFEVNAEQKDATAFYSSDFLYAKTDPLEPTDEVVALAFTHKLSRVNVALSVAKDSSISLENLKDIKDKALTIIGVTTSGTIDLEDGTATAGSATTTVTPMANDKDGLSYSAIVYPQTNRVTFRIELNGRIYGYSTKATFDAGKQYTYNLTINAWDQPELIPSGVSVTPWTDGTPSAGVMSDFIDIPDANFKAYLLQEKLYTDAWGGDETEPTKMIDQNRDGQISIAEAEAVVRIDISKGEGLDEISAVPSEQKVKSLAGIEYFTNLEYLNCKGNEIEVLDVSHNVKLLDLNCMFNKLTTLDVSKNVELLNLSFGSYSNIYNKIKKIDLSKNTKLRILGCENNELTSLDFSNNPDLCQIAISDNPFEYINLSQNRELESMWVNNCGITSVNSETFNIANMPNLKEMHLNDNKDLKTIDLSQNTGLEHLSIRGTGLTSIDVTALENLGHFDCSVNDFSSAGTVNVSNNVKLYFLQVDNTKITSIDVSNNTELSHFGCDTNSGLTKINVSNNTKLHHFHCFNCNIETLDLSNNTNIKELECDPMESLMAIYIPTADHKFDVLDIPEGVTPTIKNE